ncbi:MAG: tRNA 2-selenouridine(34) synthase MnmH [Ferruginibacter sp.]
MAINKITIQQFLELAEHYPVLDVRSPAEFDHAHIPAAFSLPIFSDDERRIVGTTYKQQSRGAAIKAGLDLFGNKMSGIIDQAEKILTSHKSQGKKKIAKPYTEQQTQTVLIHCWRGGMRSAGIAWLLDLYGFTVYTLTGGYKAYRKLVLEQFDKDYSLNIVGGYTGSGKTEIIKDIIKSGQHGIDLEGIANHKGSAFGALGQLPQPTQEMFENILAGALTKHSGHLCWLEDESQRIGSLNIPNNFWKTMRSKPVYFINIPYALRLDYIVKAYGKHDKEKMVNSIIRIQKRLGPLETKTAIGFLLEDDFSRCFDILLKYYDKQYVKALYNRENIDGLLIKIDCSTVDHIFNTEKLLACATVNV